MSKSQRTIAFAFPLFAVLGLFATPEARANFTINGSFGANGDVGFPYSPPLSISFGAAGSGNLYQMDGFVNGPSTDFGQTNSTFGSGTGVSADLGYAPQPPAGLTYSFSASTPTGDQLLLSYTFTNTSASSIPSFQFLYYVDPDIATYDKNYATINNAGSLGGTNPSSYQVGDPSLSTIFTNLKSGQLSNTNDLPALTPGDVSIALGFNLGTLAVGQSTTVEVLLSDDKSTIGNFSITTADSLTDIYHTGDTLTVSGFVMVPEPSSVVLLGLGLISGVGYGFRRSRRGRAQA